jgi:hypothetical protein
MWANHLNPDLNKNKWTLEEDLKLMELVNLKGMAWSKIAKHFDGRRNEHMVKNRYNSITRLVRKERRSKAEATIIRKVTESLRREISGKDKLLACTKSSNQHDIEIISESISKR